MDLLSILERLDIEALTVDETAAVVGYWWSVPRPNVITAEFMVAKGIPIDVWDTGALPPNIEPADLPTKFVTEIVTTIS